MKLFIQFERSFDFFLKNHPNGRPVEYFLNRRAAVKDIIESLGVPHTEVGGITFNHQKIDFSYIPRAQGVLQVHGIDPPFKVLSPSSLRPAPLKSLKFIADVNVIRLGRLLIMLGFDVIYSSAYSDQEIADIADTHSRIVLTRDTGLLKRNKIIFVKRIQADLPYDQLIETVIFFELEPLISVFSRCTKCNIQLVWVAKNQVRHLLEPKTKRYVDTFFQCPRCKKVFWKGSHYDNMQQKISSLGISIN